MRSSLSSRIATLLAAAGLIASSAAAQAQTTAPSNSPSTTAKKTPAAPALAEGQFKTEAEAKSHCPADTVVWVNFKSKVYHYAGNAPYGKTKRGAYMCEKEATGFHAAKGEKKS